MNEDFIEKLMDDISDLFVIDEINENVKQLVKKVR